MAQTLIKLQTRLGKPVKGQAVSLSFLHGGVTKKVFTNKSGLAIIEHSKVGSADIIIKGKKVFRTHAPTSISVTI